MSQSVILFNYSACGDPGFSTTFIEETNCSIECSLLLCQEFFMRTKPNLLASFPEVYPRTDNQNPVVLCAVLRLLAAVAMPLIPGSASSV